MDTGLWVTCYDLPDDGRDAYLSWLHRTYMPGLLERPGFLWAAHYATVDKGMRAAGTREARAAPPQHTQDASVPTGDRYLLLVGAENAAVFGDPVPSALHASLPEESRRMLATRIGERTNIMAEFQRVEGPAAEGYNDGMAPAPCIQFGNYDAPWQEDEEVLAWYTRWRMPSMGKLPGCIRTRRLASISGASKQGVLYEFASLDARNQYFPNHETANPEMKAWTNKVASRLIHAPGSSYLASRIWPAV